MTTTSYPTRPSTRSRSAPKPQPSKEVQYNSINAVVNDWWVVVGDRQFPVASLKGAHIEEAVVTRPPDWAKVRQSVRQSLVVLCAVILVSLAFAYVSNLSVGFGCLGLWAIHSVIRIVSYGTTSIERTYTLMLATDSQPEAVPIATSAQGVYINIVMDDINKRIAVQRRALPSPEQAEWRRSDTGAPTRRLTAPR